MHPEVSDLLREAAQDPPPRRYDVEDAVRAGKRRQRRRRTGVVIAAVVAVAVAIGVPQITTRAARPAPRPATPTPSPTVTVARVPDLVFTFRGYSVGELRVDDPYEWSTVLESAAIHKAGAEAGDLGVYQPGVDPRNVIQNPGPPTAGVRTTETTSIHGRPAYHLDIPHNPGLLWEYTDGAMAVVLTRDDGFGRPILSDAELRQLAEAFRLTPARPVTLPFASAYVPAGYRVVSINGPSGSALGTAHLALTRGAVGQLEKPDPDFSVDDMSTLGISVDNTDAVAHASPRKGTICDDESTDTSKSASCFIFLPGGKYVLSAFTSSAGKAEVIKVLKSTRIAQLDDPATWFPASTALPASTLR